MWAFITPFSGENTSIPDVKRKSRKMDLDLIGVDLHEQIKAMVVSVIDKETTNVSVRKRHPSVVTKSFPT